jgi:hypothetical protein
MMRQPILLALGLLLCLGAARAALPVLQMDVCGLHERATSGPAMMLSYDKVRSDC